MEANLDPSSPVLSRGGRDLVQRLNSLTGRQGVVEVRWRGGSVGLEFRRKVVTVESVGRLCEDGATKLRRTTRGARMNQILTRVLLCLLPASPEQARRSVCGLWAMFLIWASAVLFVAYLIFGFCGFFNCTTSRHASCLVLVSIVLYNSNHHPQLISGPSVTQRRLTSVAFPSISSRSPLVNSPETPQVEALLFHD
ncbi:unnamed protein product [Brassica oleracea]